MNLTFQQLRIGDKFRLKGGPTVYTKTGPARADSKEAGHANTEFTNDLAIPVDFYVDARLAIKPEHYYTLREFIEPLDTPERRADYIAGRFKHAERCKNLAMRYRWDLTYLRKEANDFICYSLYDYMNDDQIDSALRHILRMDMREALLPK